MKIVPRTLNYYQQIFYVADCISNWPLVILSRLFPLINYRLHLKSGPVFEINHFLSALTIKEIFYDEDYKPLTKNPRTIVDIGANIGTCTVYLASKFPKAKIISFEPDPTTYRLLQANIKLNHCDSVTLVNQAVSNKKGSTVFYSCQANGLSSLNKTHLPYPVVKTHVRLTTIPDLMRDYGLKQIDILKIDAEGAEFDVLLATPRLHFGLIKEIILEYHDTLTSHHHEEIVTKLHQSGYKVIIRPHPLEDKIGIIHAYR